jgi:inorganic pyrophosphatase
LPGESESRSVAEGGGDVGKKKKLRKTLSNPSLLAPFNEKDGILQVVIETPKGSRNKYAFDQEQKVFALKKVLPAGMAFPYDFGFVPSTVAEDGDPVDVLILMDEPAFVGCLMECRMVGIIEGEQGKKKKQLRNDRIVAIAEQNYSFADIQHVNDLGKKFVEELEQFFVNYHSLDKDKYRILGAKGPSTAKQKVRSGMRAFSKK